MHHTKSKRNSRTLKMKATGFIDKTIPAIVVFVMVFYPMLLPLWIARADDATDTQPSASSDQSSSSSSSSDNTKSDQSSSDNNSTSSQSSASNSDSAKNDSGAAATVAPDKPDPPSATTDNPASTTPDVSANPTPDTSATPDDSADPAAQPTDSCGTDPCAQTPAVANTDSTTSTSDADSNATTGNNTITPDNATTDATAANTTEQDTPDNATTDASQQGAQDPAPTATGNASGDQQPSDGHTGNQDNPGTTPPTTDATIQTGDAAAASATTNEINTNIVSNNYAESVTNITGTQVGDIDLSAQFQTLVDKAKANMPNIDGAAITNTDDATIANTATANTDTGNNSIDSAKVASIATGAATAQADIVNIVNTNLVGNTWLFAVINVLGTWVGNLIVPGADLLSVPQNDLPANLSVTNDNNADISNNSSALADTGNNAITGAGSASITTGAATSASQVKTIANTNIVQNNWFFLMINNMGSWTGEVFGWNANTQAYDNIYSYDFTQGADAQSTLASLTSLTVHNTNNATISNNATADANTGNNSIDGARRASITTGDANAQADIFNLVNTNITGSNWLFGLVNVLGSWQGDVVFAHPQPAPTDSGGGDNGTPTNSSDVDVDSSLHLTRSDSPSASIAAGKIVTHSILVKNTGKDELHDAKVTDTITGPDGNTIGSYTWDLGTIKKGKKMLITYQLLVNGSAEPGDYSYDAHGIAHDTLDNTIKSNHARIELAVFVSPNGNAFAQSPGNALIPVANAQSPDDTGTVLGQQTSSLPVRTLPFWILLASLLAYFLAINWSEFSMRKNK